jgi:hypothetical protein
MKKAFIILLSSVIGNAIFAQPATRAIEDKSLKLDERYQVMKSSSQTFQNYKVIKEYILDGFWDITRDTLAMRDKQLNQAKQSIQLLQARVEAMTDSLKMQQASVKEILYHSEHIRVLGIDFGKKSFLILIAAILGGMVFVVSGLVTRMKLLNAYAKEKILIADSIAHEYEEFKRKALEKQTKLSRELQNERNKLMELRPS